MSKKFNSISLILILISILSFCQKRDDRIYPKNKEQDNINFSTKSTKLRNNDNKRELTLNNKDNISKPIINKERGNYELVDKPFNIVGKSFFLGTVPCSCVVEGEWLKKITFTKKGEIILYYLDYVFNGGKSCSGKKIEIIHKGNYKIQANKIIANFKYFIRKETNYDIDKKKVCNTKKIIRRKVSIKENILMVKCFDSIYKKDYNYGLLAPSLEFLGISNIKGNRIWILVDKN